MKYLNTLVSVVDLAQRNFRTIRRNFANAPDCLETWDDSYNITVVNARKDLKHTAKMVA